VILRVGTRRSKLALAQCAQVCARLESLVQGLTCELVHVATTGDQVTDRPLREAGGKGLFVKELDESLLAGEIDCAVHSLKDVPTDLPEDIEIVSVPERADPRDVLLSMAGLPLEELTRGARVGTTSLRREAQARAANPGIVVEMLRGNVDTRLARLIQGDFDATFLAAAGLMRLGIDTAPLRMLELDPFEFIPSPGQGALCFTARSDSRDTIETLKHVDHVDTHVAVGAERAAARVLGGSCHLPVGVCAERRHDELLLVAMVASPDGRRVVRRHGRGDFIDGLDLGLRIGDELLAGGGAEIVAEVEGLAR